MQPYIDSFVNIISDDGIFQACERGTTVIVLSVRPALCFSRVVRNTDYNQEVEFSRVDKKRQMDKWNKSNPDKKRKNDCKSRDHLLVNQDEKDVDQKMMMFRNYYDALRDLEDVCEEYNINYDSHITVSGCVSQVAKIKKPKTEDLNLYDIVRQIEDNKIQYITHKFDNSIYVTMDPMPGKLADAITKHACPPNATNPHGKNQSNKIINNWSGILAVRLKMIEKMAKEVSHECSPGSEASMAGRLDLNDVQGNVVKSLILKASKSSQYLQNLMSDVISTISKMIKNLNYMMLDLD
jgi:hypothetical protein